MYNKLILVITVLFLMLMTGCSENPESSNNDIKISLHGAFIVNEGNFGKSNGSLSFYDFDTDSVSNNIFAEINNRPLGDLVQSVTIIDSLIFIIVNNSSKIEVISLATWQQKYTIDLPGSPRFMIEGPDNKAYVTNWFSENVSVIDLESMQISANIAVGAKPEQLAFSDNKIFVANSGWGSGNTISVIDPASGQLIDSILVRDNPLRMDFDEDQMLHVFCGGYKDWQNPENDTAGGIYKIDPLTLSVVDSLEIDDIAGELRYNFVISDNQNGFFTWKGKIASYEPATMKITNPEYLDINHYAFTVDRDNQQFFITDPKDFDQNGAVAVYGMDGSWRETFGAGIIPAEITFINIGE